VEEAGRALARALRLQLCGDHPRPEKRHEAVFGESSSRHCKSRHEFEVDYARAGQRVSSAGPGRKVSTSTGAGRHGLSACLLPFRAGVAAADRLPYSVQHGAGVHVRENLRHNATSWRRKELLDSMTLRTGSTGSIVLFDRKTRTGNREVSAFVRGHTEHKSTQCRPTGLRALYPLGNVRSKAGVRAYVHSNRKGIVEPPGAWCMDNL